MPGAAMSQKEMERGRGRKGVDGAMAVLSLAVPAGPKEEREHVVSDRGLMHPAPGCRVKWERWGTVTHQAV